MAPIPRRAGTRCLRQAVDAYRTEQQGRLNQAAVKLLARLADSRDASKAFARLKLTHTRPEVCLLSACIEADKVARTFHQRITKQKDVLGRAKRWQEALGVLRKFVAEVAASEAMCEEVAGFDLWSLSIFEPPAKRAELVNALDLIAASIDWRRGIAEANIAHLGATRDAHIREAAENAAIWVLAAGVYDATRKAPLPGRPHLSEVADFADVILRTKLPIDTNRVRHVLRKRRRLYVEMVGNQTKRYFRKKAADARHSPR